MAKQSVRGANRAYDPGGTRRCILSTAAARFQKHGHHATSVHDIIGRAGAYGRSAYHHVPSKRSLGLVQIERDGRVVIGCPLNDLAIEFSLSDCDFQAAVRSVFAMWITAGGAATAIVAGFSGAMAIAKARQAAESIRACVRQLSAIFDGARQ